MQAAQAVGLLPCTDREWCSRRGRLSRLAIWPGGSARVRCPRRSLRGRAGMGLGVGKAGHVLHDIDAAGSGPARGFLANGLHEAKR
jgi:hypothetical protein